MHRIASLFLLQRLKGSKSGNTRKFNIIKVRAIKFFFSPARQGSEGNSRHLTETLGEHAPSYTTVKNWLAQFKHCDFFSPVICFVLEDPKQ
jgi:hypothetical protein